MARNVYGLDLGTYEIKVYDKKKNEIWKEKDVIAIADEKHIFSVG
ncbi:MAG: rod shape-determining protein, partial [Lachnospiraceae bacterium]